MTGRAICLEMPASASRPVTIRRPELLLVEDDAGVRRSLQLLLEGEGFKVRAFSDGDSLLADGSAHAADALITDFKLQNQDGISLLHALRKVGWSAPAFLVTAFASPDLARQADAAGFTGMFDKPLRMHILIAAISRSIG